MALQSENLDAFFSDFGVLVTAGSASTRAIFDMPAELIAGGMVLTTDYTITYKTAALPSLANGSSITVDGGSYRVREVRLKDDGKISEAYLTKL